MKQTQSLSAVMVLILTAGILVGLGWANYHFAEKNISGEGFFIQWLGIRSLVVKSGTSPYNNIVTEQIRQSVKYENSFVGGNLPRYSSPLYSGIMVLPFALIDSKTIAHAAWLTTQLIALFSITMISLRITNWKPAWYIFLLFTLLTIFSYHVLYPWLDGNLSIWCAFFLLLTFLSIYNNWNEIGGIFLALSFIQPQMTILVVVYILIWAGAQKKKNIIIWFFVGLILLSILGVFIVPDWIMQYMRLIFKFGENFPPGSPGALFADLWPGLGKQLGWLTTIITGLLIVIEGWLSLKGDLRHFLWTASLIMALAQWTGIPTIPANFVGLILPLFLVSVLLTERWPRGGQWVALSMALVVFLWEWGLFFSDLNSASPNNHLNLIIPLPLILIIGLYWVRWWAIRPKRMLLENLRFGQKY